MSRYRHLIWDWNGTLLDDVQLCVEVVNEVLHRYNKPAITHESYLQVFDFPVKDFYLSIGFDFNVESFDEVADEYLSRYNGRLFECDLRPGAFEVLRICGDRVISQSILSAYNQKMLTAAIDYFKVGQFFAIQLGLGDFYSASKVENGKKLVAQLGAGPHEILFVGDTVHDFEVAQALGTDCVLIADGHQDRARISSCGCPVIDSIEEVTNLLT